MKCGQLCLKILVLLALSVLAGNATAASFPSIEISYISYQINDGGDGLVDAGDTIQFEFGVLNNGTNDLVYIDVDPGNPGVVMPPPFPELLAGNSVTIYGSYTITPTDITAGEVVLSQVTVFGDSCLGDNCPVSFNYGDYYAYWYNPDGYFSVYKTFTDDNPMAVDVTLTCTNADIDDNTMPASMGNEAVFYLTNVANGNTCTAVETVPPGYTHDNPSDCQAVVAWGGGSGGASADPVAASGSYSCELINSPVPYSEDFTVYKDFSDSNSGFVDMTLSCTGATVDQLTKPASEGSPAVFTVTEIPLWDGPAPYCTATEDVPAGYIPDESDCEGVAIFGNFPASCTIYNEYIPSDAIFTVSKVFSDDNTAAVQISLSCTDAVIDDATKQASMGSPAEFVLSDVGSGNSCTATEQNVPAGYVPDEGDCNAVVAGPESTSSCEITNTRIPTDTTFTVSKAFSDGSISVVQISLSCTAATIDNSTKAASVGSPAVFGLTEVSSGNTCTATEPNVPAGYEKDESDCVAVAASPESSSSCQIVNTVIPGNTSFTVSKVFSDGNTDAVQISLSCTKAVIDNSTKSASASSPAVFGLSEVGAGNTCTATEPNVPAGYTSDVSDCAAVSANVESSSSCQVTNTRIPATASITVKKVFSDNNTAAVQVNLNCTGASIDGSSSQSASMASPAVFSLTNVASGATCTATEQNVPAGYTPDVSNCAAVAVTPQSSPSCQITNTRVVSNASFTVNKVFSDDNTAVVQVSLSCTSASIDNSTKPASKGAPAVFSLSNVGSGNICTATEPNVPAGYEADASNCSGKAAPSGSANSCQITNTLIPPPPPPEEITFEVSLDYSGSAQVTLTCSDAAIDAATKQASATTPAIFTLTNVGEGNVCTAKVEPPNGYLVTGCNDVPAGGTGQESCTITFTQVFPNDPGERENGLPTGEYVLSTCQDAGNEPDYQALCNAYVGALLGDPADQAAAANATEQITTDNAAAVRTTGMQTTMVQVSAVDGRLGTLRGGGGAGFSASGFNVAVGDTMVSGSLLKSFLSNFNQNTPAFMQAYTNQYQASSTQNMAYGNQNLPSGGMGQANAGQSDDAGFLDEFGRWGIWISGRIVFGSKDLTSLQYGYDFDTAGLTFGMDYRFNDNFVAGIAVGYASTSADIGSNNANLDTDGYSVSLYGTWFQGDRFYMAGSVGYGGNNYDQTRNVVYNLAPGSSDPFVNVNESMKAKYDGSQFSAAISGGWEFNKNGWSYGPTFSLSYVDVSVDAYDEDLLSGSPGNVGWAAHIDKQKYQSLQPTIGFEVSKPISQSWGVMIPQAYIDVVSEVKDGSRMITGSFLGAAEADKRFSLMTDDFEETFARGGIGLGFVLKNNKSAFFMADADIGRDLLSTYYINAGFRWQF